MRLEQLLEQSFSKANIHLTPAKSWIDVRQIRDKSSGERPTGQSIADAFELKYVDKDYSIRKYLRIERDKWKTLQDELNWYEMLAHFDFRYDYTRVADNGWARRFSYNELFDEDAAWLTFEDFERVESIRTLIRRNRGYDIMTVRGRTTHPSPTVRDMMAAQGDQKNAEWIAERGVNYLLDTPQP